MKYGLLTEAAFGLPSALTAHTGKRMKKKNSHDFKRM